MEVENWNSIPGLQLISFQVRGSLLLPHLYFLINVICLVLKRDIL